MTKRAIPKDDWAAFLEGFTLAYAGDPVVLGVQDMEGELRQEAHDLPLAGITIETRPRPGSGIEIMVGGCTQVHLTHCINDPAQLYTEVSVDGRERSLAVESPSGCKTVLSFRQLTPTAWEDGIL